MKTILTTAILAIPYLIGAALPPESLWYAPSQVEVMDAPLGTSPKIKFNRHIKRPTSISYSVVVREKDNPAPFCEGRGGPFTYRPTKGPLVDKDLVWWTAGNPKCAKMPVGTYWAETCWKLETPLRALLPNIGKGAIGWLLPPKTVCRTSQAFNVYDPGLK